MGVFVGVASGVAVFVGEGVSLGFGSVLVARAKLSEVLVASASAVGLTTGLESPM